MCVARAHICGNVTLGHMMSQRHLGSGSGEQTHEMDISRVSPTVAADPVLSAAFDALLSYGPNRMTLTDVARRAGVSRMTVYRRYETLPRLISAVLTAEMVQLLTDVAATSHEGDDAKRIAAVVADAAQRIATHPVMVRLLTVEPEALLPVIVQRRGSTQSAAEQLLAEIIASATDGSVRVTDPHAAAAALVTAASGFVFTSRQSDQSKPWTELQRLTYGYLTAEEL